MINEASPETDADLQSTTIGKNLHSSEDEQYYLCCRLQLTPMVAKRVKTAVQHHEAALENELFEAGNEVRQELAALKEALKTNQDTAEVLENLDEALDRMMFKQAINLSERLFGHDYTPDDLIDA